MNIIGDRILFEQKNKIIHHDQDSNDSFEVRYNMQATEHCLITQQAQDILTNNATRSSSLESILTKRQKSQFKIS